MSLPLLQAHALSIGYVSPRKVLYTDLHLNIHGGQMICLLGLNGAGKSTLLRTLCGLQPSLSGDILVRGVALQRLSRRALAREMSVVLTHRPDVAYLTVRQTVSLGRYAAPHPRQDAEMIERALSLTRTLPWAQLFLNELSDGQRQRVMIARALAQDTPLVLLDEPTAHLDQPSRAEIFRLLKDLCANTGKALLVATHEIDLAMRYADYLWFIAPEQALLADTPHALRYSAALTAFFAQQGYDFDPHSLEFR